MLFGPQLFTRRVSSALNTPPALSLRGPPLVLLWAPVPGGCGAPTPWDGPHSPPPPGGVCGGRCGLGGNRLGVSQLSLGEWFVGHFICSTGKNQREGNSLCAPGSKQQSGRLLPGAGRGREDRAGGKQAVGRGDWRKARAPSYFWRTLWLLQCGLKRIHVPGVSKEVFLHHFLNSVWLLDDFLSGNGLCLADRPEP